MWSVPKPSATLIAVVVNLTFLNAMLQYIEKKLTHVDDMKWLVLFVKVRVKHILDVHKDLHVFKLHHGFLTTHSFPR